MLKTRQQVRDDFAHKGQSFSAWAKHRRYSVSLVLAILNDNDANPRRKCLRGESHDIAVMLGLKVGEVSRLPSSQLAVA